MFGIYTTTNLKEANLSHEDSTKVTLFWKTLHPQVVFPMPCPILEELQLDAHFADKLDRGTSQVLPRDDRIPQIPIPLAAAPL